MQDNNKTTGKVVSASQFQKYFKQIPESQRKPDFEKLSNYRCYANSHYEK